MSLCVDITKKRGFRVMTPFAILLARLDTWHQEMLEFLNLLGHYFQFMCLPIFKSTKFGRPPAAHFGQAA